MLDLLLDANRRGYAVPSFCVWNADMVETVLRTCERMRSPVILMNGPGEFPLISPAAIAGTVRGVGEQFDVHAAIHLDHGDSIEMVQECIDAGYTSVMLDYSERPFDENAHALQEVVAMARPLGITVEGEIGAVGKIDDITTEGGLESAMTDPEDAKRLVELTRIDTLAVSFGNAHGNYIKVPDFDFPRLEKIRALVKLPIVLHGGSGTPDADIHRAISLGIAKVNVASALDRAIRESLLEQWNAGRNLWVAAAQAEAMKPVETIVEQWIIRLKADGKGNGI